MTEERVITRKRKRLPGTTVADPYSQPEIETLPPSSPEPSPRPLVRLTRKRLGRAAPERVRSESPDPLGNLYDEHSRTASPEPVSPPIATLDQAGSSFTIAPSSDFDELPSSQSGPVETSSDPLTIEQMLRRLTGKANLGARKEPKRRRLSGPNPHESVEASSATRRKGKNAKTRTVGFSDRLLLAAATSGVELADDAPCLPSDGRKPLLFRRVEVEDTTRLARPPLQENKNRSTSGAARNPPPSSTRKKAPAKPTSKSKPLDLVPLEPSSATGKTMSSSRR